MVAINGYYCYFEETTSNIYVFALCRFGFVLFHELVVLLINDANQTHINSIISSFLLLSSIIIIAPTLTYQKLVGSLYLVGLISAGGIIYHTFLMMYGRMMTPIPLPFLPTPDVSSRLFEELMRPSSFYWEPASYVTFMLVPLFLSIHEKKNIMIGFWLICILLSSSTNGIVLAPAMVAISVLSSRKKNFSQFLSLVVLIIVGFVFFNSNVFEIGIDKAENTEMASDARLSNGPWLVSNMPPEDLFWGIPVHGVKEYISLNNNIASTRIVRNNDFYMSDFWYVLVVYGVIGLILHLAVYFKFLTKNRQLLPYILILLIAQFSQSLSFRSMYFFQLCCLLCFVHSLKNTDEKNITKLSPHSM